jgi:hypothetical protein
MPVNLLRGYRRSSTEVKFASANSLQAINSLRKIPSVNNSGISRWYK